MLVDACCRRGEFQEAEDYCDRGLALADGDNGLARADTFIRLENQGTFVREQLGRR